MAAAKIGFVVELARRLHEYGTSAQRLEGAIEAVARRLSLSCQIWSNPTGMILSFSDPANDHGNSNDVVKIIRLPPGETHLARLAEADAIAESVLAGKLDVEQGRAALRALHRMPTAATRLLYALAFSLAAACVAGLLRASFADVAAAATVGLAVGGLQDVARRHPRLAESFEAVAALLATLLAGTMAALIGPISVQTVVVGAIVVLLPGMMLTNAVTELAAQHWVSGAARLAGAFTVLLKLAFGTMVANQLLEALHWQTLPAPLAPSPVWLEWLALALSGLGFTILFRAAWRDLPLVMASACLGYLAARYGGALFGSEIGVFFAGFAVSVVSNIYARWRNRPGALVRVPGIILVVPGSVGFRSLSFMFARDFTLGFDMAVTLLTLLVSLVAGLLFGNLFVPARRNL